MYTDNELVFRTYKKLLHINKEKMIKRLERVIYREKFTGSQFRY